MQVRVTSLGRRQAKIKIFFIYFPSFLQVTHFILIQDSHQTLLSWLLVNQLFTFKSC